MKWSKDANSSLKLGRLTCFRSFRQKHASAGSLCIATTTPNTQLFIAQINIFSLLNTKWNYSISCFTRNLINSNVASRNYSFSNITHLTFYLMSFRCLILNVNLCIELIRLFLLTTKHYCFSLFYFEEVYSLSLPT